MRLSYLTPIMAAALLLFTGRVMAATEIPFEFRDGMIWVKVTAANSSQPLHFLLDSGASASVLDLGTARRLGTSLGSGQTVQGVNTRGTAYKVRSFTGSLGSTAIPRSLLALDLSPVSAACHRRIDGLLGADFFRGRIVQIDYATRKVRVLSRGDVSSAGAEVLPLTMRNGAPCVRVSVNGHEAAWTRVDTGCDSALQWVANGAERHRNSGASIGLSSRLASTMSADVQLGSACFNDIRIGVHSRSIFAGEAGLLGNGLLSRFSSVTFDLSKKQLLLRRG